MNKLKVWGPDLIEPGTILQAERTARLDVVEAVALMPDAHFGKGATVGSVVATRNAIIPAAVGVDIGCGMAAVRTDVHEDMLPESLAGLMPRIAKAVPAGVGVGRNGVNKPAGQWWGENYHRFQTEIDAPLRGRALDQFGSLGSGNHFFEVDLDEDGFVWLVVHSGSRGLGNVLGQRHIKTAGELAKESGVVLEDIDLAYLTEGTDTFAMYVADMLACQDYALGNRSQMMDHAFDAFQKWYGERSVHVTERINCHHNFAQKEGDVWVTRKGAISAQEGQLGIIPGSMGDKTYIVAGKGNPESFCSCSHGAGRNLSRAAAKRQLTTDGLADWMTEHGITWLDDKATALLDEHPMAYKRIDDVMAAQVDLVTPVHTLRQILNYKGA